MTSWPSEVYNKETGQVFKVFKIFEFDDSFGIIIKVGRKLIIADIDQWEMLTISRKTYVYSMITKKMDLRILRTKHD